MTPQEKDRIECAIRHIESSLDVDPWAVEIAVKAMKTQLSAEGTTSDLISRQAAMDALCSDCQGRCIPCESYPCSEVEAINALPSAHPEIQKRKEESAQNVPKEDLISRKAAIDALWEIRQEEISDGRRFHNHCSLSTAVDVIKDLPSAQHVPQWIPVSERLPESKHEDLEYPTVIVCCGDGAVTLACYYESTKEWGTGEYYDRIINPVAWMPLPEPYRAERRTDEQT